MFSKRAEFDHFTSLFCEERLWSVQRFIMQWIAIVQLPLKPFVLVMLLLFIVLCLRWLPIVLRLHVRWRRKFKQSARTRREMSVIFYILLRQHEHKKQN